MANSGKRGSSPGERRGPGRKGIPNKATAEAKRALEDRAGEFGGDALAALAYVAKNGQSEAARVSAAVAILDRAYGKPKTIVEGSGKDGEIVIQIVKMVFDDDDSAS